jgi:DNA recombination protein RmuC
MDNMTLLLTLMVGVMVLLTATLVWALRRGGGNVGSQDQIAELTQQHYQDREALQQKLADAETQIALKDQTIASLREDLEQESKRLKELHEQNKLQFEQLASKILEEKSEKFSKQNKTQIEQVLTPLNDRIKEFKEKVERVHQEDAKQYVKLEQQLASIGKLNESMMQEAKNLTNALKGDVQTQGAWGEMILQTILERSGLREGKEYETQSSYTTEDDQRLRPDVIVRLPQERFIVIDSKVSLNAYEAYASTDEPAEQERHLKAHVQSLKNHVSGLSKKDYDKIHDQQSPDYVLMFVPIEAAYTVALSREESLYTDSFDKRIIIVSPTTLMATLATVDTMWRQQRQTENALKIADRGGKLLDKLYNYLDSFKSIGQRLDQAKSSYDEALGRLSDGHGNLVWQAEQLKQLGVSSSKELPEGFSQEDAPLIASTKDGDSASTTETSNDDPV